LSNTLLGNYCVIFENVILINSSIGNHSYVQRNTRIVNAKIGKFCSIAADVSIGPGLHKMDAVSTHPSFYLKNTPLKKTFSKTDMIIPGKLTEIGSDVWIGERAILLDGIKVGNGAIIAAGSVVTKDVEDYSIVGGVPAKHIRFRFEEHIVKDLLAIEWWNQSEDWLSCNQFRLADLNVFLKTKPSHEKIY
jgi:acetyltransferase-like isoleucine patch superfamily enzyme